MKQLFREHYLIPQSCSNNLKHYKTVISYMLILNLRAATHLKQETDTVVPCSKKSRSEDFTGKRFISTR